MALEAFDNDQDADNYNPLPLWGPDPTDPYGSRPMMIRVPKNGPGKLGSINLSVRNDGSANVYPFGYWEDDETNSLDFNSGEFEDMKNSEPTRAGFYVFAGIAFSDMLLCFHFLSIGGPAGMVWGAVTFLVFIWSVCFAARELHDYDDVVSRAEAAVNEQEVREQEGRSGWLR